MSNCQTGQRIVSAMIPREEFWRYGAERDNKCSQCRSINWIRQGDSNNYLCGTCGNKAIYKGE